jgi:hypothetical protein
LRRRLRFVVDLITSLVRVPARAPRPEPEQRSAEEVNRRLEETHSRLKRERPPLEDLDQR